jgi:hypothetical protein
LEFGPPSCDLLLPAIAFVPRYDLRLIRDSRPHLHEPMPVPKQLPQIPILRIRCPDSRKAIFQKQPQQEAAVLAVGFLLPDSLGLNLRRISNPQPENQLCQ